jgi:hypothetical protein
VFFPGFAALFAVLVLFFVIGEPVRGITPTTAIKTTVFGVIARILAAYMPLTLTTHFSLPE